MKKLMQIFAGCCLLSTAALITPAYGAGFEPLFSGIAGLLFNGDENEIEKTADSTVNSSESEGPAPNSGDGIPDGSGMNSPYGSKKKH